MMELLHHSNGHRHDPGCTLSCTCGLLNGSFPMPFAKMNSLRPRADSNLSIKSPSKDLPSPQAQFNFMMPETREWESQKKNKKSTNLMKRKTEADYTEVPSKRKWNEENQSECFV
jgi:hypothetical protein